MNRLKVDCPKEVLWISSCCLFLYDLLSSTWRIASPCFRSVLNKLFVATCISFLWMCSLSSIVICSQSLWNSFCSKHLVPFLSLYLGRSTLWRNVVRFIIVTQFTCIYFPKRWQQISIPWLSDFGRLTVFKDFFHAFWIIWIT